MLTKITKGLNAQEKEEMEANYKASALFRERLTKLLNDQVKAKRGILHVADAYADASWPYKVADTIGYERDINDVILMIS